MSWELLSAPDPSGGGGGGGRFGGERLRSFRLPSRLDDRLLRNRLPSPSLMVRLKCRVCPCRWVEMEGGSLDIEVDLFLGRSVWLPSGLVESPSSARSGIECDVSCMRTRLTYR